MPETKIHTHGTKGNIMVLYILIYKFLDSSQKEKM
jgi:hypothetical protein